MARGGYRKPRNPAPVSNPQSGRRTDGGAGQPVRVASGQPYGERKAMVAAQSAAPMDAGDAPPSPAPPSGTPTTAADVLRGQGPLPTPDQIFGPTRRPNEPLGPSSPRGERMEDIPADVYLRMLYQVYPSPYLARLLSS